MTAALKAEFRKLLSVRSTYAMAGLALLMVIFFAFFIEGYKAPREALADPNRLASEVTSAIAGVSGLLALVGLLLVTHEYRYNTIVYTLTASNSRSRTLLAKIIAVSCYALLLGLVFGTLSPILTYLGVHLRGLSLVPQTFHVWDLLWRSLFYSWGYAMAAMLFAVLIRSQVGTIVTYFFIPGTIEALAGLLLKHNTVYLPFTALAQVARTPDARSGAMGTLSPAKGALVFGAYLLIGWLVGWYLFLKRDAT